MEGILLMAWKIRSFRNEDLEACQGLYSNGLLGGRLSPNDTGLDMFAVANEYMDRPGNHFWVAEDEQGRLIGMIGVQQYEAGGAYIRRLRVAPDCRRRGISNALMETALRFCNERQYLKITIDTFVQKETAVRLLGKFRYRHDRTRQVGERDLLYFYLDLYSGMPRNQKGDELAGQKAN